MNLITVLILILKNLILRHIDENKWGKVINCQFILVLLILRPRESEEFDKKKGTLILQPAT